MAMREPPGGIRDETGEHVGQRDIVSDAQTEFARDGGNAFGAGAQSCVVEIDVAAFANSAVQVDAAVAATLPAMEVAPAIGEEARTTDVPIVGDTCLFRGDADHGLKSRTRRVTAGNGLVEERLLFVGVER